MPADHLAVADLPEQNFLPLFFSTAEITSGWYAAAGAEIETGCPTLEKTRDGLDMRGCEIGTCT